MAWQKLRVTLKGDPEPVTVVTSARDWAPLDYQEMQTAGALFRVTHNALKRTGAQVPLDYEGFLEVLDGMPEVAEEDSEAMDPTRTAPSGG